MNDDKTSRAVLAELEFLTTGILVELAADPELFAEQFGDHPQTLHGCKIRIEG